MRPLVASPLALLDKNLRNNQERISGKRAAALIGTTQRYCRTPEKYVPKIFYLHPFQLFREIITPGVSAVPPPRFRQPAVGIAAMNARSHRIYLRS
jgi:hypothetical protein